MERIILVIHLMIAAALVAVVLMQKSEGGALGIGGGGMSNFMTGRGTASVLTRATAVLAACFMLTSLVLVILPQLGTKRASILPADVTTQEMPRPRRPRARPCRRRGPSRLPRRWHRNPQLRPFPAFPWVNRIISGPATPRTLARGAGPAQYCGPMTRFIFITGGVVSSLGKGISAAALGALLQARGFKVRLRKLDPYLNVDPGTMSPTQHGEVYVTDDGAETDLDLGHYERFTGVAQPARATTSPPAASIRR